MNSSTRPDMQFSETINTVVDRIEKVRKIWYDTKDMQWFYNDLRAWHNMLFELENIGRYSPERFEEVKRLYGAYVIAEEMVNYYDFVKGEGIQNQY